MMRTRLLALITGACLCLWAAPAGAQESGESQLGGYAAAAAGWAFSFQPIAPALLPTGDAPFETTFSLSTANVKSGGNSLGRSALVWPGSAAANMGPLLGTGVGQYFLGGLVPPWPAAVEASAKDGEIKKQVSPAVTMRAFGSESRSEGDVRTPDVNFPGFLRIDSVSSSSIAEVTDVDVMSSCTVHLEGVSLLDGAITFKSIHSRSVTRSTGGTSSADGALQLIGLKVTGIDAQVAGDGLSIIGMPSTLQPPGFPEPVPVPGPPYPLPGTNPDEALNAALENLGASIKLTRSVENAKGGSADRLANGITISINNPAVEGGRFEVTLASTGSSALATLPVAFDIGGLDLSPSGPDLTGELSAPDLSGSSAGSFASSALGELALGGSGGASGLSGGTGSASTDVTPSLAGYRFEGVSWQFVLLLLVLSVLIARWLRRFLQSRLLS